MEGKSLRCFFCGANLMKIEKELSVFSCPQCRASFLGRLDAGGCVIGLEVRDCGTPDCCQKK